MAQKILKVGSSLAVTIPKRSVKDLGFKAGDSVVVYIDAKKKQVIIEAEKTSYHEIIDWTDAFIAKYKDALDALADK